MFMRRCIRPGGVAKAQKYLDIPAEDPVVFSGRFGALPGRRLNS
jgi:hypothetical protein